MRHALHATGGIHLREVMVLLEDFRSHWCQNFGTSMMLITACPERQCCTPMSIVRCDSTDSDGTSALWVEKNFIGLYKPHNLNGVNLSSSHQTLYPDAIITLHVACRFESIVRVCSHCVCVPIRTTRRVRRQFRPGYVCLLDSRLQ